MGSLESEAQPAPGVQVRGAVTRPLCSGRGRPGMGVVALEWAWPSGMGVAAWNGRGPSGLGRGGRGRQLWAGAASHWPPVVVVLCCVPHLWSLRCKRLARRALGSRVGPSALLTAGLCFPVCKESGLRPCLSVRAAKGTECGAGSQAQPRPCPQPALSPPAPWPSVSVLPSVDLRPGAHPGVPAQPSPPSSLSSPHGKLIFSSFSAQLTGLGLRSSLDTGDSLGVGKGQGEGSTGSLRGPGQLL